jgi:hypothetical protein
VKVLAAADYAALTTPRMTVSMDHFNDLAQRGLIHVEDAVKATSSLTPYGALAVRVYEAACKAGVAVCP